MEIQNKDTDTKSGPDFILEYLPEALKNCRVCHEDDFVSGPIEKSNEVCPRCGLSISDSSQLMNVSFNRTTVKCWSIQFLFDFVRLIQCYELSAKIMTILSEV